MKRPILLLLVALIGLSVAADAQTGTALNQITLYSYRVYRDPGGASVNFESGARGLPTEQCADSDINYGNLMVNKDNDWLQVCNPRSRIVDLGRKQWGDFKETPSSFKDKKPRKPLPLNAPYAIDASGVSKEVSPFQQFARVRAGHMYLIRVARGRNSIYVMFRVDRLIKNDNCLLSWKRVTPPAEEDLEK